MRENRLSSVPRTPGPWLGINRLGSVLHNKGMWQRLVDYLFLMRPTLLFPVWAFLLIGFHRGRFQGLLDLKPILTAPKPLILGFLAYSLLMSATYVVNQIYDRETDRQNRKLFLLADGLLPVSGAWRFTVLLVFLSWMGLIPLRSLPQFPQILGLWTLSGLLGAAYSVPPVRLKARPLWDLLANALGYGGLNVAFGMALAGPVPPFFWVQTLPYILAVGAVFLLTTLADVPGDRATGARTTGVVLGEARTALLALLLLSSALLVAFRVHCPLVFWAALASWPLYLATCFRPHDRRWVPFAFRLSGALFGILVALKFPLFLGLSALTVLAMKLYYRQRFGINYPSLKEDRP